MIEFKRDHNELMMSVAGDLTTITADMCHAINGIYTSLQKRDTNIAAAFQFALTKALTSPSSPVWQTETGESTTIFFSEEQRSQQNE